MFNFRKKSEPKINLDAPLSPEADKFLAEATAEFNTKQEALHRDWRFGSHAQWGFDQYSGILKLDFADGAQFQADGQILGSYFARDNSWEWAWNNPHVEETMARDSKLAKKWENVLAFGIFRPARCRCPKRYSHPILPPSV